jgi:hypothetical protein
MYSHPPKSPVAVTGAGVSRMCSGRGSLHGKIQVKSSQVRICRRSYRRMYIVFSAFLTLFSRPPKSSVHCSCSLYPGPVSRECVRGAVAFTAKFKSSQVEGSRVASCTPSFVRGLCSVVCATEDRRATRAALLVLLDSHAQIHGRPRHGRAEACSGTSETTECESRLLTPDTQRRRTSCTIPPRSRGHHLHRIAS